MKITLTKSKFLAGLQCEKLMWHYQHNKNIIPESTNSQIEKSRSGYQIANLAKAMFKNSFDLSNEADIVAAAKKTQKLLDKKKTIFEAAFLSNTCKQKLLKKWSDQSKKTVQYY